MTGIYLNVMMRMDMEMSAVGSCRRHCHREERKISGFFSNHFIGIEMC